jgi:hypothetical protein
MLGGGRSCPRPRSTHCGSDHTDSVSFLRSGRYRARLAWRPGALPPSASLASSISPNGGPGVEADQLPAFDHNVPISHPEQYPVCVGERAVGVAHPDALSNPGPGISFSDIAASLRGRQLRLQHSEASAPQHLSGWLVIVLAHRLILP